ncbi:MAG TPA: AtpZ/AtpI family protein [Patescibacteria group bacterium]
MVVAVKMINNYFEIDKRGNLKKTSQSLKKKSKEKKDFFSEYININIGYSLIIPILVGVIVGLVLDNKFHSKPIFTVLFIFLGTVSSFYNLFKLIK